MSLFSKDEMEILKNFAKEASKEERRLHYPENKANNSNNIKLDESITKNLDNKPSPNQKKLKKPSQKPSQKPSSIKSTQSFEMNIPSSPPNKFLQKTEEKETIISNSKPEVDKQHNNQVKPLKNHNLKKNISKENSKFNLDNKMKDIKFLILENPNSGNINELIEYFTNLNKETFYDEIKTLNDEFIIKENDFYHKGKSPKIQLFYAIIENFEIKDDNTYFKKNLDTLKKIIYHINNKKIKYIQLDTFFNDAKDIAIEKLNLLTILPNSDIEPEKHYDILLNNYKDIRQILDK